MAKTECFKIQLLQFEKGADFFDIEKGKPIYTVNCNRPLLSGNPKQIEADPFLFVKDKRLYLFYEHKSFGDNGVIQMVMTRDLKNWTKPVTVLKESFHLSFPWVFEKDGQVYMIPESQEDRSIRLYQALNTELTEFKFVKKIISDDSDNVLISYCDTTILNKNGRYYLLTSRQTEEPVNKLELYISDRFDCDYKPHPLSPILKDQKTGRNGGCVLSIGGKMIRVSQDCTKRYGDNVNISEITAISDCTYYEKLIRDSIIPIRMPFYKEGGHQFNAVEFNGDWIVATDAKEYHRMIIPRIARRIKKFF